jgi:hypothetical protein
MSIARATAALSLLLAFGSSAAAQSFGPPIVTKAQDLPTRLMAIANVAVVPIESCPAAIGCGQIEGVLYAHLQVLKAKSSWKPRTVPPQTARQAMFDLGVTSLDPPAMARVAKKLGVEGLLVPRIPYGESQFGRGVLGPGNLPSVRVELLLYEAATGRLLFQGSNQGSGAEFNSLEGLAGRLMKAVLDRLIPK